MKFIADFHIHSHYSMATGKKCCPEWLDYIAALKGISVIGTGDFTHPGWLSELKDKLKPAEAGLFKLKQEFILPERKLLKYSPPVRFLLTAEISSIYKKNGKTRKVHNVIFCPDFETAERIQSALENRGCNIKSDGRPIVGLDSKHVLEIALEASENILFVPAHIWTPWFSLLGDKSGFDSVNECFEDLTSHIFAVETGLSTDPAMNWMCSFLDNYTLISNSDAHSPEKLGRNANRFDTELDYFAITDALKTGDRNRFLGTIDMFPQEGKYHYDGHRKCGIVYDPLETLKHDGICPKCGKKLTIGVMNRIAQLADRDDITTRPNRIPFFSIIPLRELIAEIVQTAPGTKKVARIYDSFITDIAPELEILIDVSIEKIAEKGEIYGEAISRMRKRQVYIKEGFDGEYGVITVFTGEELSCFRSDELEFGDMVSLKPEPIKERPLIPFDLKEFQRLKKEKKNADISDSHGYLFDYELKEEENVEWVRSENVIKEGEFNNLESEGLEIFSKLNEEQREAVRYIDGPSLILAGPGSGKTFTLTCKIADLILRGMKGILAVTFTNKAAESMQTRLTDILGRDALVNHNVNVTTFHRLGMNILSENSNFHNHDNVYGYDGELPLFKDSEAPKDGGYYIIDDSDKVFIFKQFLGIREKAEIRKISSSISEIKINALPIEQLEVSGIEEKDLKLFLEYQKILKQLKVYDFDDLIYLPVLMLEKSPEIREKYQRRFTWILVDEYQDINLAQYKLIRLLCSNEKNPALCVIGDQNQAIYKFRGADVKFIKQFMNDYPSARVFRLKRSYRCPNSILKASNNIIEDPTPLIGLSEGIKISIRENPTDKSEAEFIARTIENMIGGTSFFSIDSDLTSGNEYAENISGFGDFAVLVRTHNQMKVLEESMFQHNIPCQVITNIPFFKQSPIKDVIDVLKFSLNPENELLKRKLYRSKLPSLPVGDTKKQVDCIVNEMFATEKDKYKRQFSKLYELASIYRSPYEFIEFVDIGSGQDDLDRAEESVTIMTLHASKGLEFPCVFIAGCEDTLIPYTLYDRDTDIEEEQRLLYVGMTRAMYFLFMTYAKRRILNGMSYSFNISPFLKKIREDLINYQRNILKPKKISKKEDVHPSLF